MLTNSLPDLTNSKLLVQFILIKNPVKGQNKYHSVLLIHLIYFTVKQLSLQDIILRNTFH